ncbi:VOC family protein [Streptomyces sp. ME19-01-6]|uniref:VOC family protein n=1 Tax=Streptomyces sp. ME19-01-6 TaxID=3028686 RepID=UPI0029A12E3C|nr:VOC family protein [Streptomyces sp. ME19-01-6]MDX3232191.1 VOC family protein [Streptomyces sp. ME19-01-6]
MFGGSYIELLGIVDESAPDPWHTKAMADEYEGFRLLNLDTDNAEAADRRLTGAGLRTSGVLELERDIDTEQGLRTVRARAVHIDPRSTPEGYGGIAQHLTRAYVHQPRYLGHPNGARGLAAVLMVADDAEFDAITDRYAAMLPAPLKAPHTDPATPLWFRIPEQLLFIAVALRAAGRARDRVPAPTGAVA